MGIPALNDNSWYAYDYLQKKYGYTRAQAAGVVGNIMQESTFMTNARNKGDGRDGSDSVGIGQWNGDRGRSMLNYAKSNNLDPNSLDTQLDFLHHELQTSEKGAYNRLMNADNVQDATAAMIGYERPRGYSVKNPMGGDGWGNRLAWANQIFAGDRSGSAPAPVGTLGPLSTDNIVASKTPTVLAPATSGGTTTPAASSAADKPYHDGLLSWIQNKFGSGAPKQVVGDDGKVVERGLGEKLGLGKIDSIMGMDTNKGLKAFSAMAEMSQQQDQASNQQTQAAAAQGQARRGSAPPVEIQARPTDTITFSGGIGGQQGGVVGGASIDEMRKKLLLAQLMGGKRGGMFG